MSVKENIYDDHNHIIVIFILIWIQMSNYSVENFTEEEKAKLRPYFTNLEGPVFALVNLPEVVKGALFARYSRSEKSLRRLFLDEFADGIELDEGGKSEADVGLERAEKLYKTVFSEYGDDSVAQLGGVHLACEQVSNFLTKTLERSRLMSYLEQSTRYIPYDLPLSSGEYRYYRDPEILQSEFSDRYLDDMNHVFDTYHDLLGKTISYLTAKYYPDADSLPTPPEKRALRASALDLLRGLLPIGTISNMGIYGSGQAFEQLLFKMMASDLPEAHSYAEMIKAELMKVIPSFLTRVDRQDRGGVWVKYLADSRHNTEDIVKETLLYDKISAGKDMPTSLLLTRLPKVELISYDEEGEDKVLAAILFASTNLSHNDIKREIISIGNEKKDRIFQSYVGRRANRRHKPGRAFEADIYNFEIVSDYGTFRDLQRHRMLTIEWQQPDPDLGIHMPEEIERAGLRDLYLESVNRSVDLYRLIYKQFPRQAIYSLPMATNIRYKMEMNAREVLHLVELRSTPQGHYNYRHIAQGIYRLIQEVAHHPHIAAAMQYTDFSQAQMGRLEAEERNSQKSLS